MTTWQQDILEIETDHRGWEGLLCSYYVVAVLPMSYILTETALREWNRGGGPKTVPLKTMFPFDLSGPRGKKSPE